MAMEIRNPYTIRTEAFEGPFGLLLSLVEERKLFINDLSLSQVTEDFLAYIAQIPKEEKEELANFILVAATLILIKSKSLIPDLVLSSEEETDIKNLEERLKLYELYTSLSIHLKTNFGKQIIFPAGERKIESVFVPDEQINLANIQETIYALINKIPTKTKLPEVEVKKVISIEEMITNLSARIESSLKFNFHDFAGRPKTKEERVHLIVGFLAMLELIRTGLLEAIQETDFSDIIIEKQINTYEPS